MSGTVIRETQLDRLDAARAEGERAVAGRPYLEALDDPAVRRAYAVADAAVRNSTPAELLAWLSRELSRPPRQAA